LAPHADQEMLNLPEHLIPRLVFKEVHVVLSFVSPYFIFWILSFDCSSGLIAWYFNIVYFHGDC